MKDELKCCIKEFGKGFLEGAAIGVVGTVVVKGIVIIVSDYIRR